MYTKKLGQFVWEQNVQNLGMPHFHLGKHSLSDFCLSSTFYFQHSSFLELVVLYQS